MPLAILEWVDRTSKTVYLFPKSHWNRSATHRVLSMRTLVAYSGSVTWGWRKTFKLRHTRYNCVWMQPKTLYLVFSLYFLAHCQSSVSIIIVDDRGHQVENGSKLQSPMIPNLGPAIGQSPPDVLYCSVNPLHLQELYSFCLTPVPLIVLTSTNSIAIDLITHEIPNGPRLCASIGFRSGFSSRDISGVYLCYLWQGTKIEQLNNTSKVWLIA